MADRKGTFHMCKKLIALSIALLTIGGSLSFTATAEAAPNPQPGQSLIGYNFDYRTLILVLKPGQDPLSDGQKIRWYSSYDSNSQTKWIGSSDTYIVRQRQYDPPGSSIAGRERSNACTWPVMTSVCANDFLQGYGAQLVYLTIDGTTPIPIFFGVTTGHPSSVDIFTLVPDLTLPPDFLAPKTYGNPASVTGYAPALPATPVTPTAPAITAGTTSVIYNGVPQSGTYSVDQESSCSTTYNGSAIPPVQAGTYAVSLTCTANSLSSTATTTLTITKAAPVISWSTPSAITTATKLGSSQLNAFSYIPGSFTYSASAGSTLPIGDVLVTATFTPTDTTNYTSATMTVTIKVTA
jgi:hypothetical protein